MTETTIVYVSRSPVLEAFWAEWAVANRTYREQIAAFRAGFPGYDLMESSGWGQWSICALRGTESPGKGWRRRTNSEWVPDIRYSAGRAARRQMDALRLRMPSTPGMPDVVFFEHKMHSHSLEHLGGAFWSRWSVPPELAEAEKGFDPAIWQRGRLSEYWAAKEAEHADA